MPFYAPRPPRHEPAPVAVPVDPPAVVAPAAEPETSFARISVRDDFPSEHPPVATTKEDLAGPGTLATAIVAPRSGEIPVAAGTPVVLVAKSDGEWMGIFSKSKEALLASPTIVKFRRAIVLAWGAFFSYVVIAVIAAGGPGAMTKAEWIDVLRNASLPATVAIGAAYGLKVKRDDNDPTAGGR